MSSRSSIFSEQSSETALVRQPRMSRSSSLPEAVFQKLSRQKPLETMNCGPNRRAHSRPFVCSVRVDSRFYRRPFAVCPLNAYSRASIASFRSVPHW